MWRDHPGADRSVERHDSFGGVKQLIPIMGMRGNDMPWRIGGRKRPNGCIDLTCLRHYLAV